MQDSAAQSQLLKLQQFRSSLSYLEMHRFASWLLNITAMDFHGVSLGFVSFWDKPISVFMIVIVY